MCNEQTWFSVTTYNIQFPMHKPRAEMIYWQTRLKQCLLVVKVVVCRNLQLCTETYVYLLQDIRLSGGQISKLLIFRCGICVIETCYQRVPIDCIQIFGGHTSGMKILYLDMGT